MSNPPFRMTGQSLTILLGGRMLTLTEESHHRYPDIRKAVTEGKFDLIQAMVDDTKPTVEEKLEIHNSVFDAVRGFPLERDAIMAILGVSDEEFAKMLERQDVIKRHRDEGRYCFI